MNIEDLDIEREVVLHNILRYRKLKYGIKFNMFFSSILTFLIVILIGYIAFNLRFKFLLGRNEDLSLSDKTITVLKELSSDVNIIVVLKPSNQQYKVLRDLLSGYKFTAEKVSEYRIKVSFVDPERDLTLCRFVRERYGLNSREGIVVSAGDKVEIIDPSKLAIFKRWLEYDDSLKNNIVRRKMIAFAGEQYITSAIMNVISKSSPTIYFLSGHGERDPLDMSKHYGYSILGGYMGSQLMKVKKLLLAYTNEIPHDCDVLVIAGPRGSIPLREINIINNWLMKGGKMMCLLNREVDNNFKSLLKEWGVNVESGIVCDPSLTYTGREIFIDRYGEHKITQSLKGRYTVFFMPVGLGMVESGLKKVTVLASTSSKGWIEKGAFGNIAEFNKQEDIPGPVAVAVVVERGIEGEPAITSKLVVIGDDSFVSNDALSGWGAGNEVFFLSCMNWLADRDVALAIEPRSPTEFHHGLSGIHLKIASFMIILGPILFVLIIGLPVWIVRRR